MTLRAKSTIDLHDCRPTHAGPLDPAIVEIPSKSRSSRNAGIRMFKLDKIRLGVMLLSSGLFGSMCSPAVADVRIEGQVLAGGGPIASSTVTLWAASAG